MLFINMYMDLNSLNALLPKFWTAEKCGKHEGLADQHGMLLMKNLLVKPEDLFEQLAKNTFTFQNFSKISWVDFLRRANLAEYLKPEYINDALNVTTARPAIGKGEFLFASCFANIGFSSGKGDLVDMRNNTLIEFKGIRSTLSGDGKEYKQMNRSLMYSVFSQFNTSTQFDHFNRDCGKDLDELLKHSPDKIETVLKILQNLSNENTKIANMFGKLYRLKGNIFNTVGAMQLYTYMNLQKSSYLLMTNDQGFCCFQKPEQPIDAYNIVTNVKLSSWETGNRGMTIGI